MPQSDQPAVFHGTTIVAVRKDGRVCLAGDGQVTMNSMIVKGGARKVRRLHEGAVLAGFAGATADAMTLFERLEGKLDEHGGNLARAAVELAKAWRTDRYLRRLEALLLAADKDVTLMISGTGDVLEPDEAAIAIGSGGGYAHAAALALLDRADLGAEDVARRALAIAGRLCVFTNDRVTVEVL